MSDNHYQADTIYKTIFRRFDEDELQILCFHLNIDYDNLGGSRLDNKIMELVLYFERRNSLGMLVRVIKDLRKDILWNDTEIVSFPFEKISMKSNVNRKDDSENEELSYIIRPGPLLRAFGSNWYINECIEGFRIGKEYTCDFMIITGQSFRYDACIIKVESSKATPFTNSGEYTPELNRSISYINNCFAWIERNKLDFAKSLGTFLEHSHISERLARVTMERLTVSAKIIIGRRYMFSDDDDSRRAIIYKQTNYSIEITNYDRLLDADQKLH